MTQQNSEIPSFNLWNERWIPLEARDGSLTHLGIHDALVNAQEYVAIYDASPLVVVGIHRLLTAILQDALELQENEDLEQLWQRGKFPADKLEQFGKRYAERFDLFSEDRPFLQSADLAMFPNTKEELKDATTVARLFSETPSGTLVTHYRHSREEEQVYSPATVATGLVAMPPFISSGGPGLMPSINGVPPIYVLPGGETLFETLARSLLARTTLGDKYSEGNEDHVWWRRDTPVIVQQSKKASTGMSPKEHGQLARVGYLHGLTFPARKVRLHPERLNTVCARSGEKSEWVVRTMVFKMGESVRADATLWQDPFVAYKLPPSPKESSKRKMLVKPKRVREKETPLRPMRGKAAWREFSGLFMQRQENLKTVRPLFISQLMQLESHQQSVTYPFRCVALQTDGKMKFFEWMDFGFDIPPALLQDPDGAEWTEKGLSFATECARGITRVFAESFKRDAKSPERYKRLRERLEADFWSALAGEFRQFVLDLGERATQQQTLDAWFDGTARIAQKNFDQTADDTGDDGNTLKHIVQGKQKCARELGRLKAQFKQGANDE